MYRTTVMNVEHSPEKISVHTERVLGVPKLGLLSSREIHLDFMPPLHKIRCISLARLPVHEAQVAQRRLRCRLWKWFDNLSL